MYEPNLVFVQVLISLIIGMWIGVVFKDTHFMKYFENNNWVIGLFLAIIGFMNYVVYTSDFLRNVNLILVIVGLIIVAVSLFEKLKKR